MASAEPGREGPKALAPAGDRAEDAAAATGKPLLLVMVFIGDAHRALIRQHFDVLYAPSIDSADRAAVTAEIAAHGRGIRAVLTNGSFGLTAAEIDAMPALQLVCTFGVGHENVALAHATARGIRVSNGAGTNDSCVADHAMALLLAAVRGIATLNRQVREGVWRDGLTARPQVAGHKLGILGLGAIGRKIARRATGFDLEIGYHARSRRDDVAFAYFDTPLALAAWADFLVVATPGGHGTRHLVDAAVLQALGPGGVLVNISRGSTVDTAAVAAALREKSLLAAALDVYESEPLPPQELLGFDNVVLTPHVAGTSPQSTKAAVQCFIDNASAFFAGRPLLTPIN